MILLIKEVFNVVKYFPFLLVRLNGIFFYFGLNCICFFVDNVLYFVGTRLLCFSLFHSFLEKKKEIEKE
jgi:hypothetical protein